MPYCRASLLPSNDHFSVDGTLIEAWSSMKSFRRNDGKDKPSGPSRNGERGFHKENSSHETHGSTTDPDARLYRKGDGQGAKLSLIGHILMESFIILFFGAEPVREWCAGTSLLKNDLAFKERQIERLKAEREARTNESKEKLDEFWSEYGDTPEAICAFAPDHLERLRNLRHTKRSLELLRAICET
jgi:hypothetical protein